MVGYISKYLSYTQSCVGCIGRLVYSSKKLASGVARSIQKGLCVTGLMLVPVVCAIRTVKSYLGAWNGCVSGSSGQVAERACVESKYYLYDIVNM